MKTYARYKDALEAIATGGVDNPTDFAATVLRSRKPVAKPKEISPKTQREKSEDRADRNYREWIAAGKPSWREWGKIVGLAPSTAARWVNQGKEQFERQTYLRSQEHKDWCDEQIALTGWEDFKKTWSYAKLYEEIYGVPDDSHSKYFFDGDKWRERCPSSEPTPARAATTSLK